MAVTPFRAKAEERAAKIKKDEDSSPEPSAKRPCNTHEKQLAKLPKGDLETVKDMVEPNYGWWIGFIEKAKYSCFFSMFFSNLISFKLGPAELCGFFPQQQQ